MQPHITDKLGTIYKSMNMNKKGKLCSCYLQGNMAAMMACGTLSCFTSNMFDVTAPLISSRLASIPVGSASRNLHPEQQFQPSGPTNGSTSQATS